jgi:uncharacterized membrane protein YfcA
MEHFFWLIPLGFLLGAFGTLIGAGGGFVLVPALLLLYPDARPETITCISLAVVFFNALSGSVSYARMARIDYKSGLWLAAATIPGAILGVLTTDYIPRQLFNSVFGIFMISTSLFLLFNQTKEKKPPENRHSSHFVRKIVEKNGTVHSFSYNLKLGIWMSMFIGYISSLLGIGGGVIHVPALIRILNYPVHIATATSHFILAIMALTGTIVHIATGSFSQGVNRTIFLAIGVIIGAQLGAKLSSHVHSKWIMRGLAISLAFIGIRILIMAF